MTRYKHSSVVPLFERAKRFPNKVAIHDVNGEYTFSDIFVGARKLSENITKQLNHKVNERVLFLCSNDVNYVTTLWAIWMSGQIAVPLSPIHPEKIISYYVNDTNSKLLISTDQYIDVMERISKKTNTKLYVIDKLQRNSQNSNNILNETTKLPLHFYENNNAFILYTSGTTGNPKGVVLSHKNLNVQIETLIDAWRWSSDDTILHTLPLHHIHGTVNALFCPLYVGATTLMIPKFSAETVWSHLLGRGECGKQATIFMAVPTIYSKLIQHMTQDRMEKEDIANHMRKHIRLMVSGSAPLPTPVFDKWYNLSGHKLLERYGMTEIGMCLSNEYHSDREPSYVGVPLPRVSVRIAGEVNDRYECYLECTNINGNLIFNTSSENNVQGELLVKGAGIFQEYFDKSEATKKEFTKDGWFKTGDMCEFIAENKKFRILGRKSVDIIKSGGYKISALQIETVLLGHPYIQDCAVVGIDDETWGQKIAAIITTTEKYEITLGSLKKWASDKLPKYSLPTILKIVQEIPKNAMGKVNKKELVKTMFVDNN